MTENEYLELVKNYLNNELATSNNELLTLKDNVLMLRIPDGLDFNGAYVVIQPIIETSIKGIKKRKYDINFTIWSANQLRDFKIYK